MTTEPGFAAWRDALEEGAVRLTGAARPWAENRVLLRSAGSTNALARRIVDEYLAEGITLPPAVLVALEQTAGRGRQGRAWESPPGAGAYVTMIWRVADAALLTDLPLLVPVALAGALDRHLPDARPCRIKWPNDLLVAGRKIGGVLIDAVVGGDEEEGSAVAVIGFGVNRAQEVGELPATRGGVAATSLAVEAPPAPAAAALTWELVEAVSAELSHAGDTPRAVARFGERSAHRPGDRLRCRVGEETLEGRFRGFDGRGFLRLELSHPAAGHAAGEEVSMRAGEVVST
jgi:BirA family biotin operon repressor/biotin-[acetyl-CoA-carboxylase] ligase